VIQGAIGATGTSRALADTDVGLGLLAAAATLTVASTPARVWWCWCRTAGRSSIRSPANASPMPICGADRTVLAVHPLPLRPRAVGAGRSDSPADDVIPSAR